MCCPIYKTNLTSERVQRLNCFCWHRANTTKRLSAHLINVVWSAWNFARRAARQSVSQGASPETVNSALSNCVLWQKRLCDDDNSQVAESALLNLPRSRRLLFGCNKIYLLVWRRGAQFGNELPLRKYAHTKSSWRNCLRERDSFSIGCAYCAWLM